MSEIQQSLNLHNLLQNVSYDNGVICTYTFDPEFFEEYCLERFNSLKNNGNLSVIVDFDTYQQVITAPPEYRPKQANIRYLLHPISVAGRFHPKLFLLVNRNKGRLIVGSANFTRPGITANAEMINYFDYEEEKNEEYAFLFRAAFAFLNDLNQRKPNTALTSNLAAMERIAPWLVADAGFAMNSDVMLLHNLNQPLWDQILHHVKGPVDGVCILSRFFDSTPKILDRIENDLQPKYVKIFTQNVITTLTKEWFKHPLFKSGKLIISCCSYADEGHSQNLHAKALAIIKDDKCIISFGSANFTTQALLKTADGGNVECLVLIPSLSKKDADPDKLFDPQSTAEQLFDEQSLKTAPRQKVDQGEKQQIHIYEANLSGDKIQVQARIDQGVEYEDILAKILFHNEAYSRLLLYPDQGEIYYTESAAKIIKRLGESSSVITLEARKAGEIVATSNALLVTNLIDIRTGQSVRRERHIKEAQQSAIDFFRILDSLIREGEENSLLTFFNFCDIPIIDVASSPYLRSIRPEWDPGKGMRILGIRNLKIFNDLHGAAINFYTRHFKKLQRHVERGGINGVANYLHIFLAMGGVLRSQVERLMQGFEASSAPISAVEWHQYRSRMDTYFVKFKELMSCLHDQYLPGLMKVYKAGTIQERFAPELQPLRDLYADMMAFQKRMNSIAESSLKIITPNGTILAPPFFKENIFITSNWSKYENEQNIKMKKTMNLLAA